ncbi:MAG: TonB-dependent receptor [Bacteroidota bacterium]|nr:TonB-dependent receptor [Bacteroidota bacterium]
MTDNNGSFHLQGMSVGGPYAVTVSFVGMEKSTSKGIFLQLGQTYRMKVEMEDASEELEEVVIERTGNSILEGNRTGSETNIDSKQIEILPSISRGQEDLTRLTPQANGNSFGGRNNLYNNFSLDGSIFNNSFGLDYATPGGQADAQPVSMDAIKQIKVSLAPFDVREGGFSGAGINAVTKSGTNELKASVYYYGRNENMIGNKVGDTEIENYDFGTMLSGFTVGGPIVKNKLFFFVSAEAERRDQLAHGFVADNETNSGPNVTSVDQADIIAVQQHLRDEWDYDPGAYQGYNHETYNNKFLAKLNWNINKKHKFSIRYNMLDAWKDILPHPEAIIGRGPTSYRLPFENSSYTINNDINSVVSELNSRFSNKLFNKVLVSYTQFRDFRKPHSDPFPVIDIFDTNGNLAITAGSEMFSTNNILDQDVYQFNDNLTYYAEKHTITAGVNFEMFQFNNSFNLFYYPWHMFFGGVDQFLATSSADMDFNAEVAASQENDFSMAEVDVAQLAFYIQDKFNMTDNLDLTFGIRVDMPLYLNSIDPNTEITDFDGWTNTAGEQVDLDPSQWPSNNLMWSPRIGFNWNVIGDNTLKLRGGSGIFTGRIPFVWLGNQSTNSFISPGYTFQINDTEEGFRYPQVWKSDLAVDVLIGEGWIFTAEGIYGKDINAVVHRNYNMLAPSGNLSGADERAIFAGFNEVNIYSADATTETFLEAGAIVMENVDEGYQSSLTAQLKKDFNFGLSLFTAYTYMESKDYTSIPAEIAADAFQRNAVVGDPNQSQFSYSRYGLQHRYIMSAVYRKEYGFMASSFGLFFELGKGNRYSYTYAGDLNQDAIPNNDLLYVPASQSEINFGTIDGGTGDGITAADADAQWAALNSFIEQDEYLSTRRGDYAERNGAMLPWFSQLDLSFAQDFTVDVKGSKNTLRLSIDMINFGNMINSSWGVRQFASTTNPITVNGLDSNNEPYFSFDTNLEESYIDDTSVRSKWQIQFGVRYIFN